MKPKDDEATKTYILLGLFGIIAIACAIYLAG